MSSVRVIYNRIPQSIARQQQGLQALVNYAASMMVRHATERMGSYPPISAPGAPPNIRTGDYIQSFRSIPDSGPNEAEARSDGNPGLFLEKGTVKMSPRPHWEPAIFPTSTDVQAAAPGLLGEGT